MILKRINYFSEPNEVDPQFRIFIASLHHSKQYFVVKVQVNVTSEIVSILDFMM